MKASIRAHGLAQSLRGRPSEKAGRFRIVAGSRRFRVLCELATAGDEVVSVPITQEFQVPVIIGYDDDDITEPAIARLASCSISSASRPTRPPAVRSLRTCSAKMMRFPTPRWSRSWLRRSCRPTSDELLKDDWSWVSLADELPSTYSGPGDVPKLTNAPPIEDDPDFDEIDDEDLDEVA